MFSVRVSHRPNKCSSFHCHCYYFMALRTGSRTLLVVGKFPSTDLGLPSPSMIFCFCCCCWYQESNPECQTGVLAKQVLCSVLFNLQSHGDMMLNIFSDTCYLQEYISFGGLSVWVFCSLFNLVGHFFSFFVLLLLLFVCLLV